VTHVLSFKPLDPISWPARQVWTGDDPLLNRAWARAGEPLFLSRLEGSRGRVAWERAQEIPVAEAGEFPEPRVVRYAPNQVVIEAETPVAARLVLTDLFYPGWEVRIDGRPATPEPFEGMY